MITSLTLNDLCRYTSLQLNNLFPDNEVVNLLIDKASVSLALDRLEFCFKEVSLKNYFDGKEAKFNHLFSDHYVMFLWFLSNSVWRNKGNCSLASKIYYLNKSLHGLDCMYDTKMPNIFLIFHGVGTMLGKAEYNDYFVVLQGCTVGSQKGKYPKFGKGVSITANSSVIGDCQIGDRASISTRTTIFEKKIEQNTTTFVNLDTGKIESKITKSCYAQQFFNTDLNN
jgi:serine O-acetyltransferase